MITGCSFKFSISVSSKSRSAADPTYTAVLVSERALEKIYSKIFKDFYEATKMSADRVSSTGGQEKKDGGGVIYRIWTWYCMYESMYVHLVQANFSILILAFHTQCCSEHTCTAAPHSAGRQVCDF